MLAKWIALDRSGSMWIEAVAVQHRSEVYCFYPLRVHLDPLRSSPHRAGCETLRLHRSSRAARRKPLDTTPPPAMTDAQTKVLTLSGRTFTPHVNCIFAAKSGRASDGELVAPAPGSSAAAASAARAAASRSSASCSSLRRCFTALAPAMAAARSRSSLAESPGCVSSVRFPS